MPTTAVILVFHSRLEELQQCLESLSGSTQVEVVIVDVSPEGEALKPSRTYSVAYLPANQNLGYSWALNLGAKAVTSEVIIFSNSDVVYSAHAIQELSTRAQGGGVWAPVQLNPEDGSLSRNTVQLAGSRRCSYARWLGVGRMPRIRRDVLARLSDQSVVCGQEGVFLLPRNLGLSGACIAMSRSIFDQLGGWDETYFLYDEDTDISMRAHQARVPVGVAAKARVYHSGGYKLISDVPAIDSPSPVSERSLWAKHSIGPEWEIRGLQLLGIAIRRFARKLVW
jgi:GT2 family glycosyltransferase